MQKGALPFDKIQFSVKEAGDFAGFFALLVMLLRFCYYSNSSLGNHNSETNVN